METILWETDWEGAFSRSRMTDKPVFVYFFRPEGTDCRRMDAVTFCDQTMVSHVNRLVIPARVPLKSPWAERFNVSWTPQFLLLDPDERVHHRIIGFMPPGELIPKLLYGTAKTAFQTGNPEKALALLNSTIEDYPETLDAVKAIYLRGIVHRRGTHEEDPLKRAYHELLKKHPEAVGPGTEYASYRLM